MEQLAAFWVAVQELSHWLIFNLVFVRLASPGKFDLFLGRATLLIDRGPNPFRCFILPIGWRG